MSHVVKSSIVSHIDETDTKMIQRLLRQASGEIPFDENFEEQVQALENSGLTFEVNDDDTISIVEDTFPNDEIIEQEIADDDYDSFDVSICGVGDYISDEQERHRKQLRLGDIPYKVGWFNGFTYSGGPIPYKSGSRMRKAFDAGRRQNNE